MLIFLLFSPIWRVLSQSKGRPSVLLPPRFKECILTKLNFRYEEIFLTVWTQPLLDLSCLSNKYTRTREYQHFIFLIWILINQTCRIVQHFTWLGVNRMVGNFGSGWILERGIEYFGGKVFHQKMFKGEGLLQAGLHSPPQESMTLCNQTLSVLSDLGIIHSERKRNSNLGSLES